MGFTEKFLGYAVFDRDSIDVRTVSDTRRAAIVNWLVVTAGRMISNEYTDGEIERIWDKYRDGAVVDMVEIRRATPH